MLLEKDFVMQGGVRNYLGETQEVQAPKYWKSSPSSPSTELAYITEAEKGLLLDANLHGSLKNNQPNVGASGLLSYDGWGDASDGFGGGGADANDGFGGGDNNNNNNNDNYGDGGWENTQSYNDFNETPVNTNFGNNNNNNQPPDPVLPPGVISNNFDYETDAYSTGPNDIDQGYGLGEITNATYNKDTGLVDIEQTPGIINTEQYQTANLGAYLDSPDVSDKDKINTLNQLQALSNSDLKGSKLSNIETDFVMQNLDLAFNNVKDQTKYSEYTSSIDENATTFAGDLSDNLLGTVANSGGIIGTMIRGVTDTYKNNKALGVLGYTGKTIQYNPDGSGDFNYGGGFLTGNVSEGEREAINQLTPLASNIIGGTQQQPSMVNNYFANNPTNTVSAGLLARYNQAKTDISARINSMNDNQFGLNRNGHTPFTQTNKTGNPFFIDYLKDQGLI
ncbi:hypothetical protein [uncultured Mediterranean phage uvMED]|nr:hypothetical protein [uncultured Mediterranean phage uvMED]BAR19072.1 hypothetical protein [uncultured Mediterranean phage uvMED]